MTGKIAALRAPRRVRWEKLAETRPFVSRLCSLGLHAALGFMGGCVRLPGNCAPFGIALTAVSGCGGGGLCCMLGAAAGYVATGGLAWGVRYASALLLVFTAGFVFRDTPAMDKRWFLPAAVGVITAMTGALSYFESLSPLRTSVALGTEVALAVVCTVLFSLSLATERCENEQEERRRRMGQALLLCCAVAALCRWKLWPGVVPGRGLAVLGVMLCAFFGGSAAGALAATALGALREAVDSLGDVSLTLGVAGQKVALAESELKGSYRGESFVLYPSLSLGGGENYVDDLGLVLRWGEAGDDEQLALRSHGDHAAAGGSFTDESRLTLPGDGNSILLKAAYTPGGGKDSLKLELDAGGNGMTLAGGFRSSETELALEDCLVTLTTREGEELGAAVNFRLHGYEELTPRPDAPLLLSEISQEKLAELVEAAVNRVGILMALLSGV